mmetsp:Transcript_4680/g.11701  ORF Transcript_4680/g.11701 Transcript_4680/m.11701 type:complete len:293 (+) Transcript_4680:88-966(+)
MGCHGERLDYAATSKRGRGRAAEPCGTRKPSGAAAASEPGAPRQPAAGGLGRLRDRPARGHADVVQDNAVALAAREVPPGHGLPPMLRGGLRRKALLPRDPIQRDHRRAVGHHGRGVVALERAQAGGVPARLLAHVGAAVCHAQAQRVRLGAGAPGVRVGGLGMRPSVLGVTHAGDSAQQGLLRPRAHDAGGAAGQPAARGLSARGAGRHYPGAAGAVGGVPRCVGGGCGAAAAEGGRCSVRQRLLWPCLDACGAHLPARARRAAQALDSVGCVAGYDVQRGMGVLQPGRRR